MHKLPIEKARKLGSLNKKGKKSYADLKQEFREIEERIDDVISEGGKVLLNDPLNIRLKQLQRKMNKQQD